MSTSTRTSSSETAGDATLAQALAHGRAGRLDDALATLLRVWARRPGPRLADLIAAVSARALAGAPPSGALRSKKAAAIEAWSALAGRAAPLDVPPLLESLTDVSSGDARTRLALVDAWPPDPRVDEALARMLETVPYRATSTQPFWRRLFARLRQAPDPRLPARLAPLDARYEADLAVTMAAWLRAELAKLVTALRARRPSDEPDEPALAELEAWVAALGGRQRAASRDVDALLAAIHEHPDDDELRLVYADALTDRGDPRGELIAIQCRLARGAGDAALRRREKQLLDAHGKTWLGALAPLIMSGFGFERGFLASCRVDRRKRDLVRELAGHPAWSTVGRLSGSAVIALHPVMRALRSLEFDAGALEEEELEGGWRDLLIGRERPIEELDYRRPPTGRVASAELAALCACRALPRLTALAVEADPSVVAASLLHSEVIRRLQVLRFRFETMTRPATELLAPFAGALADAPVHHLRFTLLHLGFHPTEVELERGPDGYHALSLALGPTTRGAGWSTAMANEAITILVQAPPTVRRVRLHLRKHMDPDQAARVREAAAAMPGVEVGDLSR
jgi:uncharacterized protein (TIGR02996 family)